MYDRPFLAKIIFGLLVLILAINKTKTSRRLFVWHLLWIVGIPILFSFYGGEKPEYYYSLQFPVWLMLIVTIIINYQKVIGATFLTAYILCNISSLNDYYQSSPLGIQEEIDIARYINSKNPGKIVYFMPHGTTTGLEYLIHLNASSANIFTVEYPKNDKSRYQFETQFSGVKE